MKSVLSWIVAAIFLVNISACGTILYPERKGQVGGRIDIGVALLDAVGLFLFFIPGVIAFAVDFSNGTIYLPSGSTVDLSPAEQESLKQNGKVDWPAVQKLVEGKLADRGALPEGHWQVSPLATDTNVYAHLHARQTLTVAMQH